MTIPDLDVAGDLLRRVNHWPDAGVVLHDGRATIYARPADAAIAVLECDTGHLIARVARGGADAVRDGHPSWHATPGEVSVDLTAPEGPAAAEALLRRRLELELYRRQALVASP